MTLVVKNANKDLEKLVKAAAKLANASVSVKSKKNDKLKEAINEYERDKKNGKITQYASFTAFEKDM